MHSARRWAGRGNVTKWPDAYAFGEGRESGGYTVCVTRIISIVGPESTGKSTLAGELARHFGAPLVEEYARAYLTCRPAYDAEDLAVMGRAQAALEAEALEAKPGMLILDTDLLVVRVWWEEKFGPAPTWLKQALAAQPPRHYLLTAPDIPWEADPLREWPFDRERLFEVFRTHLASETLVDVVRGSGAARLAAALRAIARVGRPDST